MIFFVVISRASCRDAEAPRLSVSWTSFGSLQRLNSPEIKKRGSGEGSSLLILGDACVRDAFRTRSLRADRMLHCSISSLVSSSPEPQQRRMLCVWTR